MEGRAPLLSEPVHAYSGEIYGGMIRCARRRQNKSKGRQMVRGCARQHDAQQVKS
jgi:hypothetical protein